MTGQRGLRLAIAVLAVIGFGISGYLTYVHYFQLRLVCLTGGCEVVQTSSYAYLLGVPVALLGMVGYALILASLLVRGWGPLLGLIFAFVGFGFSMYLTYLELFQIHAICQWCVASAVVLTIITVLAAIRYLKSEA